MIHFQEAIFKRIEEIIGDKNSIVPCIAEILGTSTDSVYRRMRLNTALTFDEGIKLAQRFGISLSSLTNEQANASLFFHRPGIDSLDKYRIYLEASLVQLQNISAYEDHFMYYSAKEVPIFYHFGFPLLAKFKIFIWLRSMYGLKINGRPIEMREIPQEFIDIAHQQHLEYQKINSIEIWNETSLHCIIRQMEFAFSSGYITDKDILLTICDEIMDMLRLISIQASAGKKSGLNSKIKTYESDGDCNIYFHEILLMDNHILAKVDKSKLVYIIPYAGLNYLHSFDQDLACDMEKYLKAQTERCVHLKTATDKDRNKFFTVYANKVNRLVQKIKEEDPFI